GVDGQDGEDGVGITSTTDNNDGTFTLNFSDGSTFTTADLTGPQGATGPTGPTGPQGPIGIPGNDGVDGQDGEDGVGITSTTDNNDGTFTLNFSDGSSFTTTDLTGPQGATGPTGPQGPIGIPGNDGVDGQDGEDGVGITSTTDNNDGTFTLNFSDGSSFTTTDLTGPQGATGQDGQDGVGITSTTDNGDGTFTLNFSDGSTFTTADLTGEQGPTGPAGPTGPQGPMGNPGNDGQDGADGQDGVGITSTTDNGDGTFTLNFSDGSSFTTTDLTGPQGATGQDGQDGVGITSTTDNNDGTFTLNFSDGSTFTTSDLTGPQGATGPTGPQGPIGNPGNDGVDGQDGEDGVGITSTTDNNDGTFTLNFSDGSSFTTTDLTGPQGPAGNIESLTSGSILVGDTGNAPTAVSLSGDATLANDGALTISNDAINTSKIQDASVTDAKLDKNNIPLSGFADATDNVNMGTNQLKNLADPTDDQDAVTKSYAEQLMYTKAEVDAIVAKIQNQTIGSYPEGTVHCDSNNPTEVVDVFNPVTGQIWMDRNLGASQVATSSTDAAAYGDLYQWGRGADGHQCRDSGTTSTLSSSDQPGHGDFITNGSNQFDWRSPQNDNLWQGVNGVNNPCPSGYRLPTEAELDAERESWSSNNSAGAFASPLKLPMAGYRRKNNALLYGVGTSGDYWSSTVISANPRGLYFFSVAGMDNFYRADGFSVRCLKD
ncbi:hypothetical protein FCN74_07285, partial [Mesohalobacter halotolerans]